MLIAKKPAKQGLSIIIVGCGKVGLTLIEQLVKEGHDITIIDQNAKKVQEVANTYDVMGITGNGASHRVQMDAGIASANLLIAVTESDELNLLCCTVANQVANCSTIARVRTPDYSGEAAYLRDKLGLAMIINPELEAAKEISRILYLPTALEVNSFAHGQAELIKIQIPENNILDGISVSMLSKKINTSVLICGIERNSAMYIPSGDSLLLGGDKISFVAPKGHGRFFLEDIGIKTNQVKSTMIIGGSKAAYYLAKQLLGLGMQVKIIEQDWKKCEDLCDQLPKATIICGNAADHDLLIEEGIEQADALVSLTGMDEENIILALFAKTKGVDKIVAKVNEDGRAQLVEELGIDLIVSAKTATADAIMSYVRARQNSLKNVNVESMYQLVGGRVEALEFIIKEKTEYTDIPFKDLELKPNNLIACIGRKRQIIIPDGDESIQVGDSVVIVTTQKKVKDITDILAEQ